MSVSVNTLIGNLLGPLHSDSTANLCFWTDAELTRFFDEAVKSHARKAGVFIVRDITSITLVQGTAVYDAPARHISTLYIALDGVPLIASSSSELELLDDSYKSTQGVPLYWYADKEGVNKIGFYPVPNATAAGKHPELIINQFPPELDEAHSNTTIPVPACTGDYLEAVVLGESYSKESDARLPETSAAMKQLARLFEQIFESLYGVSQ
ncbi:MAG: hypothetical protein WBV94_09070 [Blastocatellia bacterium]